MSSEKDHLSVGPWGGQGGARWDDGVYSGIRQLVINHGAVIDSIQIEYDKRGCSVWSAKHGGSGALKTDKVKLDHPEEFITSISGHYGCVNEKDRNATNFVVRSLTFETNKKKRYGPIGIEQGTPFSTFPVGGGKVVGFHGRSSRHLDSIGVYLKPLLVQPSFSGTDSININWVQSFPNNYSQVNGYDTMSRRGNEAKEKDGYNYATQATGKGDPKTVTYGPWGGNGGTFFDDGLYTGVREIHLKRFEGIVSIRVWYDRCGKAFWEEKNGGTGGVHADKIAFDYPSEILTHITGSYGSTRFRGPTVVKSLSFHTNKRKYGPFGEERGIPFSSKVGPEEDGSMVVGFHGRKGWFVDSIGVHVAHGKLAHLSSGPDPASTNPPNVGDSRIYEVPRVMMEPNLGCAGPWGGDGGEPWDDGVFSGIKKIFLTEGVAICSLQIEYDRNGQSVWSSQHGTAAAQCNTHWIIFHYPYEVLTCISGYYGPGGGAAGEEENDKKVIKSLTFHSNRGQYGPYGEEMGTYFSSTRTQGKVVGFHGRSRTHVNAIGVHMQHWLDNDRAWAHHRLGDRRPIKTILNKIFY